MRKRKIFSKSKYILLSVLMCSTLFIGCEKKDTNNVTKTKEDIIMYGLKRLVLVSRFLTYILES